MKNSLEQKLNSKLLPWPVPWVDLFGRQSPLIVEIGFGYAVFLAHLAQQNPDSNIVGLEVSNRCLTAGEDIIRRKRLTNARVVHSTAETALHHLFEPGSISQVHINFPDPWFKKKHGHRRLMQRDTLDVLVNRIAPGGALHLVTDIIEYAEMSHELLAATPGLDNVLDAPWALSVPGRTVTKYESKARHDGRDCYYFHYRRNHQPAAIIPVIKDLDMPHIVFKTPLSMDEMSAPFNPSEHKTEDQVIHFLDVYRGRYTLLFDVYIKEATIEQRIALILTPREFENEYTLKLGVIGHPRSTAGVHRAAGLLGDWLASLHPGTQVLQRTIQGG